MLQKIQMRYQNTVTLQEGHAFLPVHFSENYHAIFTMSHPPRKVNFLFKLIERSNEHMQLNGAFERFIFILPPR